MLNKKIYYTTANNLPNAHSVVQDTSKKQQTRGKEGGKQEKRIIFDSKKAVVF